MIGTNPGQAQAQINKFLEHGRKVDNVIYNAIGDFTLSVSTSWYSPKAVQFRNTDFVYLENAYSNLCLAYENIAASAARAFNAHARANDIPTIGVPETGKYVEAEAIIESFGYDFQEKSPNGTVGMDKATVEIAMNEFHKKIDNAMQLVDETPYDIAFYDEDGSQVATFKNEINKMKSAFITRFKNVDKLLQNALNEEIQTVELAAKQAVTELQSTTQL